MEISFIVKQQSISVVIRSEQWKKFMWNTVESVLKSANPPNISWVHIHGSVKSSDLQQIMERTKQHSTRACPNTQEPVSQDWSQLYICIYRRRAIVRLLAETNLSERYNHDKTETTSAGCNVRSAVRQLDSFYTADHLTLTTQMMAGERNDSQTGHALAQGPLATDIMAASSATLWISSTVCRAVEDQKPGPNRPRWNAFQMTVLTSDPVPGGDGGGDEGCREIDDLWVRPDLYCGVQSVTLLLLRVQRNCRGQLPPTRQVSTSLFPSNTTCCRVPLPRR